MANESKPVELMAGATLSQRLRDATRAVHARAERAGFMPVLVAGNADRTRYVRLLAALHGIYAPLEEELERHAGHPVVSRIALPALYRAERVGEDLAFFAGASWRGLLPSLPSAAAYGRRIREVSEVRPELLVAHAYTRYLGDLSGGQIVREVVRKTFGLGDGPGAAFYSFPGITDIGSFKAGYRSILDGLPLDENASSSVTEEACRSFELNIAVFEEIA